MCIKEGGASGKDPACQCRRPKRQWIQSLGGEDPQRRKWQPTPVLLPGKSHGEKSLAGYSSWGCKELDMIDCVCACACTHTHIRESVWIVAWQKRAFYLLLINCSFTRGCRWNSQA